MEGEPKSGMLQPLPSGMTYIGIKSMDIFVLTMFVAQASCVRRPIAVRHVAYLNGLSLSPFCMT